MPNQTVRYIDLLNELGMPGATFENLHHRGSTTGSMREYCLKTGAFHAGGRNVECRERLGVVLELIRKGIDWDSIAQEAMRRVPVRRTRDGDAA